MLYRTWLQRFMIPRTTPPGSTWAVLFSDGDVEGATKLMSKPWRCRRFLCSRVSTRGWCANARADRCRHRAVEAGAGTRRSCADQRPILIAALNNQARVQEAQAVRRRDERLELQPGPEPGNRMLHH